MFDGFEIGMFPLVGPKALEELVAGEAASNAGRSHRVVRRHHVGVPRRRRDRRRPLRLARRPHRPRAGDVAQHPHLRGLHGPVRLRRPRRGTSPSLRFIASLGMGGEWALGVALVTELWPDRSRAWLAGAIGAAANVGLLLVGLLSLVLVRFIDGAGDLLLARRPAGRSCREAAARRRLAAADDRRLAARAADVFHPAVRPRVAPLGGSQRRGPRLALGDARPDRRAPRRPARRSAPSSCGRRWRAPRSCPRRSPAPSRGDARLVHDRSHRRNRGGVRRHARWVSLSR